MCLSTRGGGLARGGLVLGCLVETWGVSGPGGFLVGGSGPGMVPGPGWVPGGDPPPPPSGRLLLRAVRILLECILVYE